MGYNISRFDSEELQDIGKQSTKPKAETEKCLNNLDQDIVQTTKLRYRPNELFTHISARKKELSVSTVQMLAARQGNYSGRGRFSESDCCHVSSRYLPVNGPWPVDRMRSAAYISQFSADGSHFVSGFQGSHIRIYNVDDGWKVQKNIIAKSLRWTITDTSLSPDQRYLVYSSLSPVAHIVDVGSSGDSIANVTEIHEGLDFYSESDGGYSFGIFSVKFSTDGREVVAGSSNDSIYVYDLEAHKLSLRIPAHSSDVNTVCFADESGHLIFSGSDDSLCKVSTPKASIPPMNNMLGKLCVWDRRCLREKGEAAGVMIGHLEGITFIDSRGDGRYFISNGKDQTTKLWDIRKMSSKPTGYVGPTNYEWDYRCMDYPLEDRNLRHPNDQSVATYRGHSVLRTLIRCYFSPESTTGQKYIYTGSSDSCVYIYDLVSGEQVARLKHRNLPVRDCSWHPFYPTLVSSSLDGDIIRWEFSADGEVSAVSSKKKTRRSRRY